MEQEQKMNDRMREIVRSAYETMRQSGHTNISLEDIAKKAGISKALLIYYFKEKDNLVGAIYDYASRLFFDSATTILRRPIPLAERLDNLMDTYHAFIRENPNWFIVFMEITLMGLQNPKRSRVISAYHMLMRDFTAEIFRDAKEKGEFSPDIDEDTVAALMIATANGFAMSYTIAADTTDAGRFIEYFVTMLKAFIGPKPEKN
jgi:AcrR family transcriptional regulator